MKSKLAGCITDGSKSGLQNMERKRGEREERREVREWVPGRSQEGREGHFPPSRGAAKGGGRDFSKSVRGEPLSL